MKRRNKVLLAIYLLDCAALENFDPRYGNFVDLDDLREWDFRVIDPFFQLMIPDLRDPFPDIYSIKPKR